MESTYYPLSLAQQNIYSQEIVASGTDVNVLYFVLKAREPLRHDCMEEAVNLFLRENPGARTQIASPEGTIVEYIAPYMHTSLPEEDLRALSQQEQEDTFRR